MASSRSGWPRCWRRCWGRSACRAAATPMRSARWGITAGARSRCRCPPCRKAATPCASSFRWRASPTCCCSLEHAFDYNGQRLTYPEIRLVYWTGGNPFHHHQDLNRLRRAFARRGNPGGAGNRLDRDRAPRRHRAALHDVAGTRRYRCQLRRRTDGGDARRGAPIRRGPRRLRDLRRAGGAAGPCRCIHRGPRRRRLAAASLCAHAGSARQRWGTTRRTSTHSGRAASLPCQCTRTTAASSAAFRRDPDAHPLPTPSGKVEIASGTIAGFGYADCPGHPVWLAPTDVPDERHSLRLVANQPARRLHSQLDFGEHSQAGKHRGREIARLHPADAAARGIAEGDIIRLFNDRGACLAAAVLSEDVRPGVVHLPTGAWYDPADAGGGRAALRSWQSECADARHWHVAFGAGVHGAAYGGGGAAVYRQPAADPGL